MGQWCEDEQQNRKCEAYNQFPNHLDARFLQENTKENIHTPGPLTYERFMNRHSLLVKFRKRKFAVTGSELVLVVLRVLCWARRWMWKGNPSWNSAQVASHQHSSVPEKKITDHDN